MLMRLPATDREISRKSYTMKQKKTAVRLITAWLTRGVVFLLHVGAYTSSAVFSIDGRRL